jgi:hypothetical protein
MPLPNGKTYPEKNQPGAAKGHFCVLVSSSDRARDIFEIVFKNSETIWRDCDWPRYVGFTSPHLDMYGFKAIPARRPSDWRGELSDQLESLPPEIDYVFMTYEDALFEKPVDGDMFNEIAELMVGDNLVYVSLIPLRRNVVGQVFEFFRRRLSSYPVRRLSSSEPYYSSVAAAIWKRTYLISFLRRPGSIWDLEHVVSDQPHYAVWRPVIEHDQIVTRGKWNRRAARKLARQGISLTNSDRPFQNVRWTLRDFREMIVFQLVGFLSFRIRRRFGLISHRIYI